MRTALEKAIELGLKQAARARMTPEKYQELQNGIRRTKLAHLGDRTLFDIIADEARDIADFATGGRFSAADDEIEKRKKAAIDRVKSLIGL